MHCQTVCPDHCAFQAVGGASTQLFERATYELAVLQELPAMRLDHPLDDD